MVQEHPFSERWFVNGLGKQLIFERVVIRDGEQRRALVERVNGKWVVGVSYAVLSCDVPYQWAARSLRVALDQADFGLEFPPWYLADEIDRLLPF